MCVCAEFLKQNCPIDNLNWSILVFKTVYPKESKQIVLDQTAPLGAAWSRTILFAHAFFCWSSLVLACKKLSFSFVESDIWK